MRNTLATEVRRHSTCTHIYTHVAVSKPWLRSPGSENEKPARYIVEQKKNRFYYSVCCLVGFVLVSIKAVMTLLHDNQWETESDTPAGRTRDIFTQ